MSGKDIGATTKFNTDVESEQPILNLFFDERFLTDWHTSAAGVKCMRFGKDIVVEMTEHQIIKFEAGQTRFIRSWKEFTEDRDNPEYLFLRRRLEEDMIKTANVEPEEEEQQKKNEEKKEEEDKNGFNIKEGIEKYEDLFIEAIQELFKSEPKNLLIFNELIKKDYLLNFDAIAKKVGDSFEKSKDEIIEEIEKDEIAFFIKTKIFTKIKSKTNEFFLIDIVAIDKETNKEQKLKAIRVAKDKMPVSDIDDGFESNLLFKEYN